MSATVLNRADDGSALIAVDIGHATYAALTDPRTAFWALVDRTQIQDQISAGPLLDRYREKAEGFARELHALRFELTPSGVYLNPTERCNLNCTYCYLPGEQRSGGSHMSEEKLIASLAKLRDYFRSVMPEGRKPRAIFHGAEPLMNKAAVFAAIDAFADDLPSACKPTARCSTTKQWSFSPRATSVSVSRSTARSPASPMPRARPGAARACTTRCCWRWRSCAATGRGA